MKVRSSLGSTILFLGFGFIAFSEPSGLSVPERASSAIPAQSAGVDRSGVAARVGDAQITMEDYRDFLVNINGRRPLDTLIERLLVEQEAERLKLDCTEAELNAAVERAWSDLLRRYLGDEQPFLESLVGAGFRKEEYRTNLRRRARTELLGQAICQATRTISEADLRDHFAFKYGEDGELVEVQHIYLSPARLRSDLIRQGTPAEELGPAELEQLCREQLGEVLERLGNGEEFGSLAGEFSHDYKAESTGGRFENYNYRAYGSEFAAAVRNATVGVPVGPVSTESGFHVIEVTSRVQTEFEDVREALREELTQAPANSTEIREMIEALKSRVEIETY